MEALNKIINAIKSIERFSSLLADLRKVREIEIVSAVGSLKTVLIAASFSENPEPVFWLCERNEKSLEVKTDLEHLLPVNQSLLFPPSRKSRWGHDDPQVMAQQAESLLALTQDVPVIVVASYEALQAKVRSPKEITGQAITLALNSPIGYSDLLHSLHTFGFEREPIVEKPGDFAVRGGIVDLYPFTSENPVRVEFWGDTIESLRAFDIATQRSIGKIESVRIIPKPGVSKGSVVSLLDYIPENALVVFDESSGLQQIICGGGPAAEIPGPVLEAREVEAWRAFIAQFSDTRKLFFSPLKGHFAALSSTLPAAHPKAFNGNLKLLVQELRQNGSIKRKNFFLCESPKHAERMRDLFADYKLTEAEVEVLGLDLSRGFTLPQDGIYVYTDHEFYGRMGRYRGRRKLGEGLTIQQLKALKINDFVVHADHGIGRFRGLQKIKVANHERECLLLEYRDGDKLYVPLDRMDRVQKYTGKDGVVPKINKLGTPDWERLKKRTKARLRDIAEELIKLYALRKTQTGFAFSPDTTWQKELEASFPYEDTIDQLRASEEVKRDMEKEQPMDRLVCGDVGYGKTEVAVRAAFKAVQDGKQVAILVPTTILAEQHYLTFKERLGRFPVKIEVLSRFKSISEQKHIVEQLKRGEVDIVIGTHRLLSKDIAFKDLGLLIIDEEQRFGVRHKEKLKHFRTNVDVLALSATPIPRTLHMALVGVRDLSQIHTPPRGRLPVQTETTEWDPKLIRQAILYEMQRGGQVFVVHNRIDSIHTVAARIADIVPEADIAIAHGRMKEPELEKVMLDFLNKKYHVLVSTMIIEAGLDMPNVNTIFINRADRFGLAQLYQLRGRVGRSRHKAFCYLIVPPLRSLTPEAIRRLETIEEFTDLGSGMQIALRDLEIRGAGNILGAEQSGFIDAIGLETYLRILEESIHELLPDHTEGRRESQFLAEECRIDADVDAYLPQDYVELPSERVDIYRRLAHATRVDEIDSIEEEVRDRFGRLPVEAENLFVLAGVRILGRLAGFKKLIVHTNQIRCLFADALSQGDQSTFRAWIALLIGAWEREVEFVQGKELELRMPIAANERALVVLKNELLVAIDRIEQTAELEKATLSH